jgi:hypothetical protein
MNELLRRLRWALTNQGGYFSAAVALVGIGSSVYGMMSGPSGKIPTAVRARMAEDQARADRAYAMAEMLLPFQLDSAGLVPVYGPNGQITGIEKKPQTKTQQAEDQIRQLADEKVLKGLKGELDIDPGATRSLNEQDAQRTEYLLRTQGPDYKTGTAGSTQLQKGQESRNIQESALRRGETTAAEQIAQSSAASQLQEQQFQVGIMRGAPQQLGAAAAGAQDPYMLSLMDRQYGIGMGRSTGYGDIGSALLRGAGGLYGAFRGMQKQAGDQAYSLSGMNPTPGGTFDESRADPLYS